MYDFEHTRRALKGVGGKGLTYRWARIKPKPELPEPIGPDESFYPEPIQWELDFVI